MSTVCCPRCTRLPRNRGSVGSRREGLTLAADRRQPFVNRAVLRSSHGRDANAAQALRELLDNPDRNDWDELLAANRALIKAIAKNKPMTRRNASIVAEYLRGRMEGARDRRSHGANRRLRGH